jgi:pyruvate kinase
MATVRRRTKIVATIGPVSSSHDVMRALVDAGVDAVRLNLSHRTHDDHAASARMVREVQEETGKPLALIADLQGPKLRIGDLPAPRVLLKDEEILVVGEQVAVNGELPVAPAVIGEVLRPGHDVLIDDGLVRLTVENVDQGRALCRVVVGGEVKSHKGVNLPGVPIWLTFTRIEFPTPRSIPSCRRCGFVTKRSSPTSCTRSPSFCVSALHDSQSSSAAPSSIETTG